jgi:tetratricopeptide (TPR) repeat protein
VTESSIESGLLDVARKRLQQGNARGAIETLKRLLGHAPESADGHALLAIALLSENRIFAARAEVRLALELEPEHADAQLAAASVAIAHRELREAMRHVEAALALAPEAAAVRYTEARVHLLRGDRRAARSDPEDIDVIVLLGSVDVDELRVDDAESRAQSALELEPENASALCLMGRVLLLRGQVEAARDHALWALRNGEPGEALRLLVAIKARQSWVLGAWWRMSMWLGSLGDGRAIAVLVIAFIAQRAASTWATQHDRPGAASAITLTWLLICAYTWIGPALFARAVRRETESVALKPDF